jgi:large subunit ribosomal protein L9
MNIILLQDVKTLGKKGECVKVNDGYARNFIIPKKLGMEATTKNLNEIKAQKAKEEKAQQEILNQAKEFAAKLEEKEVTVTIKTGENGKMFGSVSTKEIAAAVMSQLGFDLDKKKMQLAEPIKTLGDVMVPVKIHKDVTVNLKVCVVGEK